MVKSQQLGLYLANDVVYHRVAEIGHRFLRFGDILFLKVF